MTPFNALGLLNNSNPAVSKKKLNSTSTKDNYNNHTVRFQDLTKTKLVPYIVCISYLLWEGRWHWVGHHRRWGRWLLSLWRLRVEWKRRVVHAILSSSLHAPKLRGALEALVTKGTHLVSWTTKITLSIAVVVIVVTIATARVTTVTSTVATILGLIATKGTFRPTTKPSIVVPVPVATTTTKIAPPTPRIPIPTVILVATSSPPSTTWMRWRQTKGERL